MSWLDWRAFIDWPCLGFLTSGFTSVARFEGTQIVVDHALSIHGPFDNNTTDMCSRPEAIFSRRSSNQGGLYLGAKPRATGDSSDILPRQKCRVLLVCL